MEDDPQATGKGIPWYVPGATLRSYLDGLWSQGNVQLMPPLYLWADQQHSSHAEGKIQRAITAQSHNGATVVPSKSTSAMIFPDSLSIMMS